MILRNSGEKLWLTIILLAKLHLAILGQLAPKSSILPSPAVKQHYRLNFTLFSDLGLGGAASGLLAASEGGADEAGGKDGSSAA